MLQRRWQPQGSQFCELSLAAMSFRQLQLRSSQRAPEPAMLIARLLQQPQTTQLTKAQRLRLGVQMQRQQQTMRMPQMPPEQRATICAGVHEHAWRRQRQRATVNQPPQPRPPRHRPTATE